jgi:hypothetical protein
MTYTITVGNKGFSGVVAGVPFFRGVALNVDTVPAYFKRHKGYVIAEDSAEPKAPDAPVTAVEEPETEPAAEPQAKKASPAKKATKGTTNGN